MHIMLIKQKLYVVDVVESINDCPLLHQTFLLFTGGQEEKPLLTQLLLWGL